MATTTETTAIAAFVVVMAIYGVAAEAPASAPWPSFHSCYLSLMNMSDCLTYVEDGGEVGKPEKGCCPELAGLLETRPLCLCDLIGHSDLIGVNIDLNKVRKLPSACGVSTPPPLAHCSAGQPAEESAPSPSEAADAAGPPGNKNGVLSIKASALSYILGLATAFVSVFF